jgi:undecaprenyl-diphosphatase
MEYTIAETLNAFVGQSARADLLLHFVQNSYLLKGLVAVVALVMLYTARVEDERRRQSNVYATLVLVFLCVFAARILQMVLPFSPRPLHAEGLELTRLSLLTPGVLRADSSFPSDHAMMFFAIAGSVWFYARGVAALLFLHAIVMICLPRLVLGFHWLSDLVAGALLSLAIVILLHRTLAGWLERSSVHEWRAHHPALFHGFLFAVLAETATMYSGSRQLLSLLSDLAGAG